MYDSHFEIVIEIISEWNGFDVVAEKLRRLRGGIVERGYQANDLNTNHFNTLVHDDLWCTNLMIKTGKPEADQPFENLMLIDFQFSFWASPTIDLHYFLNSSVCDSLRPHRFEEFVRFYHEHLVDLLKRLKFNKHIPTWPEFYAQYQERMFFGKYSDAPHNTLNTLLMNCFLGFMVSCLVQPLQINNTEKVSSEGLISIDEKGMDCKRSFYKGEKIRANLRKLIPYYDQLGIFD